MPGFAPHFSWQLAPSAIDKQLAHHFTHSSLSLRQGHLLRVQCCSISLQSSAHDIPPATPAFYHHLRPSRQTLCRPPASKSAGETPNRVTDPPALPPNTPAATPTHPYNPYPGCAHPHPLKLHTSQTADLPASSSLPKPKRPPSFSSLGLII